LVESFASRWSSGLVITLKPGQPDRGAEQVDEAQEAAELLEDRVALVGERMRKNAIRAGAMPNETTSARESNSAPKSDSRPPMRPGGRSSASNAAAPKMSQTAYLKYVMDSGVKIRRDLHPGQAHLVAGLDAEDDRDKTAAEVARGHQVGEEVKCGCLRDVVGVLARGQVHLAAGCGLGERWRRRKIIS